MPRTIHDAIANIRSDEPTHGPIGYVGVHEFHGVVWVRYTDGFRNAFAPADVEGYDHDADMAAIRAAFPDARHRLWRDR